jgi:hypothetical protein
LRETAVRSISAGFTRPVFTASALPQNGFVPIAAMLRCSASGSTPLHRVCGAACIDTAPA